VCNHLTAARHTQHPVGAIIAPLACRRWAQNQLDINNQNGNKRANYEQHMRKLMEPLVPNLRVLSLSVKEFLQAVEGQILFTEHNQIKILKFITDPDKYNVPAGICAIINERQKPPPPRISKLNKLEEHMKTIEVQTSVFKLHGTSSQLFSDVQVSDQVPMTIYQHMVVYGFSFCTLKHAEHDRLTLALAVAESKQYDENFTVKSINAADKICVAEYKFEGKLLFNSEVNVKLAQPFLAEKSTPLILKVYFHHSHEDRENPYYYKDVAEDQYGKVDR
jgi:hypothetical protein